MPVTKSGFVLRRAFKGCQKLCKGFKGRKRGQPFSRCLSTCISVAQKGAKRGFTRIPKRGAKSVINKCPKAGKACLKKALKARLRTPKTKDRSHK